MNEENLRKLYQRLGIAESPPPSPPPPLPSPAAPAEPPDAAPPAPEPRAPGNVPSTLERLAEKRVSISLPMLAASIGAIAIGLFLVSRPSAPPAVPPKPPVAVAPPPPVYSPPEPAPAEPPEPPAPPAAPPRAPDPPPSPAPPAPPPPELTPAEKRAARIRKNGGTDASQAAVERALDWLARHQAPTGEWEAMHFERRCPRTGSCQVKDAPGDPEYTAGVTALALLAFMGAGHSPTEGPHGKAISMGLAWLVERQDSEGGVMHPKRVYFYSHAAATRALCEAAALTRDDRFRTAAQKALDYLGKSQLADGGWNYYHASHKADRNDASISGWGWLAIRAGEEAGLVVPADTKARIRDLFVRRTMPATGEVIYSDRDPGVGRRGAGLVALGLLIRGRPEDDPETAARAASRVVAARPNWDDFLAAQDKSGRRQFPFSPDQNMAGWYYGTEAMFARGGEDWAAWNRAARDALVDHQVREGHAAGSWEPELSYIGREGGRVFSTAIGVMILGIYARER